MNNQSIALEILEPVIAQRCHSLARRGRLEFDDLCQQSRMLLYDLPRLVVSAATARTEERRETRFNLLERLQQPGSINLPPDPVADEIAAWVTGLAADELRGPRVAQFSMDDPDSQTMAGGLASEVAILVHSDTGALDDMQSAVEPILARLAQQERVRFAAGAIRRAEGLREPILEVLTPAEADAACQEVTHYQSATPTEKNTMNQQFSRIFKKVRKQVALLAPMLILTALLGFAASGNRACASAAGPMRSLNTTVMASGETVEAHKPFRPHSEVRSKQNASRTSKQN